jgi:hypothetical protein
MAALDLKDGFSKVRFCLTILMAICFSLHLQKEMQKFMEAKKTTSIRLEDSTTLKFPAVTICAEQIYNTDNKGKRVNFCLYLFFTVLEYCYLQTKVLFSESWSIRNKTGFRPVS